MRKQIISTICLIILSITILSSFCANALTSLDTTANASLTLLYQKDSDVFPELKIDIHKVAKALPNGTFELIEPFSSYPVNIHDITLQEQWKNIASTLTSYITANQLEPTRQEYTDKNGSVIFRDLETGLYLISAVIAENNSGTFVFDRFMVYLPTPQPNGSYDYDIEAKPKCSEFKPKTEYRVTKLWQDSDNKTVRPKEVTVDIYKDGNLQETKLLTSDNNWSYTWYTSADDISEWTVTERDIPKEYTVTLHQNNSNFSIINTLRHESELPDPEMPDTPQTGDTFSPLPIILIMCLSGLILLIVGIYSRRLR